MDSSLLASASAIAVLASALGSPPLEKFSRNNHLFWRTQVLLALHGAQVMGLLDGSDVALAKTMEVEDKDNKKMIVPNPDYMSWLAWDQTMLGYLMKSLNQDLLAQVVDLEHASEVWLTIEDIFSSQSRARVIIPKCRESLWHNLISI
jgi:hypothetical protein